MQISNLGDYFFPLGQDFIMSRKSRRKNKLSVKRRGRPKIARGYRRRTRRKRCRSAKKLIRKLGRGKFQCVCKDAFCGKRKFLDCGHYFHKKCIKGWLKNSNPTCPVCKKAIRTDTDPSRRANPESRFESSTDQLGPSHDSDNPSVPNRLSVTGHELHPDSIVQSASIDENEGSRLDEQLDIERIVEESLPEGKIINPLMNPRRQFINIDRESRPDHSPGKEIVIITID